MWIQCVYNVGVTLQPKSNSSETSQKIHSIQKHRLTNRKTSCPFEIKFPAKSFWCQFEFIQHHILFICCLLKMSLHN